jgi:hypothetical protein
VIGRTVEVAINRWAEDEGTKRYEEGPAPTKCVYRGTLPKALFTNCLEEVFSETQHSPGRVDLYSIGAMLCMGYRYYLALFFALRAYC